MIETFIHEEYVNKRREQRRRQQQHQHQRRRRQVRALQIEIDKAGKLKQPASATADQQSPMEHQHQPAAGYKSPVGSPTADAASFGDHFFDYLKPYWSISSSIVKSNT